jgi:O-antigen ligase
VVLTYLVFGIAFSLFVDTPERLKAAVSAFIFFHAICAANRLLGLHYFGVSGPMGDTNDFALAMNVVLPLSFFVGLHHSGKKRWLYWSFCILFVAANVKCASRGGVVGLVAVALIIVGFSRYKIKAVIALMILFILFLALVPSSFKAEVFSIQDEGAEAGTGQERVELWKIAWRGFLDNPVIGVGQGNMPLLMPKYQYDRTGESFFSRQIWFRSVHSVLFTVLPELGALGFGMWIWMLTNMYRKFKVMKAIGSESALRGGDPIALENRSYIRQVGYGMIIGVCGYLVTGIFLSAFYYPSLWNLMAMITAGYLVAKNFQEQPEEQNA